MWRPLLLQILTLTLLANWLPAHAQLHAHDGGMHVHGGGMSTMGAVDAETPDALEALTADSDVCCHGSAHCSGLLTIPHALAQPGPAVLPPGGETRPIAAVPSRLDRPPRT